MNDPTINDNLANRLMESLIEVRLSQPNHSKILHIHKSFAEVFVESLTQYVSSRGNIEVGITNRQSITTYLSIAIMSSDFTDNDFTQIMAKELFNRKEKECGEVELIELKPEDLVK